MTAIFYRVTYGQPVEVRPPIVVQIEGAQAGTTAAVNDRAVVVWTQDDRPESDEWGDLAGVQFEMELRDPANEAQLSMFADYR
jgi:hypothetical protein